MSSDSSDNNNNSNGSDEPCPLHVITQLQTSKSTTITTNSKGSAVDDIAGNSQNIISLVNKNASSRNAESADVSPQCNHFKWEDGNHCAIILSKKKHMLYGSTAIGKV